MIAPVRKRSRPRPSNDRTSRPRVTGIDAIAVTPAERRERREALTARRKDFFARPIDYIPCRQFLRADAERLATVPPSDAAVPLHQVGRESPSGDGLTPYLASLYETRLLTRDEDRLDRLGLREPALDLLDLPERRPATIEPTPCRRRAKPQPVHPPEVELLLIPGQ